MDIRKFLKHTEHTIVDGCKEKIISDHFKVSRSSDMLINCQIQDPENIKSVRFVIRDIIISSKTIENDSKQVIDMPDIPINNLYMSFIHIDVERFDDSKPCSYVWKHDDIYMNSRRQACTISFYIYGDNSIYVTGDGLCCLPPRSFLFMNREERKEYKIKYFNRMLGENPPIFVPVKKSDIALNLIKKFSSYPIYKKHLVPTILEYLDYDRFYREPFSLWCLTQNIKPSNSNAEPPNIPGPIGPHLHE